MVNIGLTIGLKIVMQNMKRMTQTLYVIFFGLTLQRFEQCSNLKDQRKINKSRAALTQTATKLVVGSSAMPN